MIQLTSNRPSITMDLPTIPTANISSLPEAFRPLFWSYHFSALDAVEDKKTIIIQLLNYGTLTHWRWLIDEYGRNEITRTLEAIPATELKPRTRALASILFSITNWRYAPRGTH